MAKRSSARREQTTSCYWFLLLEEALSKGDYLAAARYQRELERYGLKVTYTPPPTLRQTPAEVIGAA